MILPPRLSLSSKPRPQLSQIPLHLPLKSSPHPHPHPHLSLHSPHFPFSKSVSPHPRLPHRSPESYLLLLPFALIHLPSLYLPRSLPLILLCTPAHQSLLHLLLPYPRVLLRLLWTHHPLLPLHRLSETFPFLEPLPFRLSLPPLPSMMMP